MHPNCRNELAINKLKLFHISQRNLNQANELKPKLIIFIAIVFKLFNVFENVILKLQTSYFP
jgi:hypothetical protein